MKQGTKEVMSDSKVVGEASYTIYETVDEAVAGEGSEKILLYVNAQVRTNAMNEVRAQFNRPASKKALESAAMAMITFDEFLAVVGDQVKLRALIDAKVAILEAKQKEEVAA